MDDFQIWIYIIFGIIYFLVRNLKKKTPEPLPGQHSQEGAPQRKPVSFEELLKEFTQQAQPRENQYEEEEAEIVYEEESKPRFKPEKTRDLFSEEGTTRQFSDEDAKRIYEKSVKLAETTEINMDEDRYRTRMSIPDRSKAEPVGNAIAAEIKRMLSNPQDAKKAIILGEILNRKY